MSNSQREAKDEMKPVQKITILLSALLLVCHQYSATAQTADINFLTLDNQAEGISVLNLKVLKDEHSNWEMPPACIYQKDMRLFLLDSGIQHIRYEFEATYWIKLSVRNTSVHNKEWILKLDNWVKLDNWDEAYLYEIVGDNFRLIDSGGEAVPFSAKNTKTRQFIDEVMLLMNIAPGENKQYIIRLNAHTGKKVALKQASIRAINEELVSKMRETGEERLLGSFIMGGFFIMFCYNLLLFILIRDRLYLLYSLYLLLPTIYFATIRGFLVSTFIGEHFSVYILLRGLIPPITICIYILFLQKFLDTKKQHSFLHKMFSWGISVEVMMILLISIGTYIKNVILFREVPILFHAIVNTIFIVAVVQVAMHKNKSVTSNTSL